MKFWKKMLLALAAGLAVTMLWTSTAQAADDGRCSVAPGATTCYTSIVHASGANTITFWVEGGVFCAQADFLIYDTVNGNEIYRRHVGSGTVGETLNNVYSSYRLQIYDSCGGGSGRLWT